jgi:hypothetical protein
MSLDRKLVGYFAATAAATSVAMPDNADAALIIRSGAALGASGTVNIDFDQSAPEEYQIGNTSNRCRC